MNMNILNDLQGVWQSRGYGWIVQITGDQVKFYDYCKAGCIEMDRDTELSAYFLKSKIEKIDQNEFCLSPKGAVTKYTFDRIEKVPPVISGNPGKDAVINFEFFWNYFNENYAFFDLRKTSWEQVYQEFRPKVTASTSEAELLQIFKQILQKLGDMHVSLKAGEQHIESARPTKLHLQWKKEFPDIKGMEFLMMGFGQLFEMVCKDILKGQFHKGANDLIYWGKIQGNIGYLFVGLMAAFAGFDDRDVDEDLKKLTEVMDEAMEDLKDTDGIILDMRFNHGGYDPASRIIANRFADQKRVGFYKEAIYGKGRTGQQAIYLDPAGKNTYTRPVVLLTSESTISAAEIFTMFMMALPHVTRMGEPTQGVLSDVLTKTLPNGWKIGISNEIYTAIDGKVYEGEGIPVHIQIPVYDEEHFYEHLVALVNRAASYLKEKTLTQ